MLFFCTFYASKNPEKSIIVFYKKKRIVFNMDDNKNKFLSTKSAY